MKILLKFLGCIALVLIGISDQAIAQGNSIKVPFAQPQFVPCADGGAGEIVLIEGTLHIVIHSSFDAAGGAHFKFHFQPQGARGIGQSTGDRYNAVGVTQGTTNFNGVPFNDTFVNNFRLIGRGSAVSYHVHQVSHITVNANGDVTVVHANLSISCD